MTEIKYCNLALLVPGLIGQEILLAGLFDLKEDLVTENWWAKKVICSELELKCNLWLCPPETKDLNNISTLIWDKIQAVLLLANLSDPQVIKHLTNFQKVLADANGSSVRPLEIVILGCYQHVSPLTESQKRTVLEWSAEQGDWPFVEVDFQNPEALPEIWHRILVHLSG